MAANGMAEDGMRYLITGGAGFIGSHLARHLVEAGAEVVVLDDFSTGRRENLAPIEGRYRLVEGTITDLETCRAASDGADVVLHQAALGSVPRSVADPLTTHAVNATGTLNVLAAAREAGVRRVVYAASSSAYGDTETLPKHEGMVPRPRSPYAVTKVAGEGYCQAFAAAYGLFTVGLRYFNVFGPRQDPGSQYAAVVPLFATAALTGTRPTIYGDGEQSRDFTYIDNVVQANLLAEAGLNEANLDPRYILAEQDGVRVTAVLRMYAPTKPGKRKKKTSTYLVAPEAELGINEGKLGTESRERYGLD